jgi:peptide/nickel transport system substrate-binding protein
MHDVERNIVSQARSILPQTSLGYDPLPARTYDPGAARNILEQAGWRRGADGIRTRDGVRLAFNLALISGFTSAERIGLLLQASLKTVGIELAIKTYPYRTIYAVPHGPLYSGSFDLALWAGSLGWDPDLYNVLACDRWYPKGENIYGFCDPRVDELERAGLQTDDPQRRAVIYRKASGLIWSEVPWVPLFGGRNLIVRSADLLNYSVRPTSNLGWNSWQWDI